MKSYIGLGSSLGLRQEYLAQACRALADIATSPKIRVAPYYESPAMMPPGAPAHWAVPYLNTVVEMEWAGSPEALLGQLKNIEKQMGRREAPRWAPRIIDLDILLMASQNRQNEELCVPHAGLKDRAFVLDPLKDLVPQLKIPGSNLTALDLARGHPEHRPWTMAIFNLTPDSFSDGGELKHLAQFQKKLTEAESCGVQAIDLGAESTRPGAQSLNPEEEWQRLAPALEIMRARYLNSHLRPRISVDTRHFAVAQQALASGVDIINDVSGLQDERMLGLVQDYACDYVLMHSLSVPADPNVTLIANANPVEELQRWLEIKLEFLQKNSVDLNRVIFDPGIGFGKTAAQSLALLENIADFFSFGLRILVGHSRKSFLLKSGLANLANRDAVTLEFSKKLRLKGVDILRVHDFAAHANL